MAEYEELLKVVEQVENSSEKQELNFVDMSVIMSAQRQENAPKYLDLLGDVSAIESTQKMQREEQMRERQKMELAAQRPGQPMASAAVQSNQAQREPVYERYEEQMAKGVEGVKAELGTLANRLGTIKPKIGELKIKRINTKDLVLPGLSLSDQISELERIIEGLRQGVFDSDHLDVVRQEVLGLAQVVRSQEKSANAPQYMDQTERSLAAVRDQRISEAIPLLNSRIGG